MFQLTEANKVHLAIAFIRRGNETTERDIIYNLSLGQRMYRPLDAQKIFDIALEQGFIIEGKDGKFSLGVE